MAGSANVYVNQPTALLAPLALAAAVAARRRFPLPAYFAALAVGTAQLIVGIGQAYTASPLQPTFADVGILVLLYTVANRLPRRVSLPALAACAALFAAAARGGTRDRSGQCLEFVLVTGLYYMLAPVSAWVLGESMARRRVYLAALEERAVRAEAERDARARAAAADERARIARGLQT